jgi:hypothetical protein
MIEKETFGNIDLAQVGYVKGPGMTNLLSRKLWFAKKISRYRTTVGSSVCLDKSSMEIYVKEISEIIGCGAMEAEMRARNYNKETENRVILKHLCNDRFSMWPKLKNHLEQLQKYFAKPGTHQLQT